MRTERRVILRLADEHGLERQFPKPLDGRGMGVVAARDEGQTGILDVGNKAVAHQVPACPEPYRGEIILRLIEARGVVVDDGGQAVGLIAVLTECIVGALGDSSSHAPGGHLVACFNWPSSRFG